MIVGYGSCMAHSVTLLFLNGKWLYLFLSFAASVGWLLSSRQDVKFGAIAGAVLGQALALFFLAGMTVKALFSHWWLQAAISTAALCVELWVVRRWYFRRAVR